MTGAPQSGSIVSELTPQELQLVEQLKAAVAGLVEQHACLKVFCNEHTYVRYLRARSWNVQKASKMLNETLLWRLEYKPHLIRWDDVKGEATTGKHFIYSTKDKLGRPIVMMRPRCETTKDSNSQIRFLIYDLEMAARIADQTGVGKMCWLLDFEGYTMANAPPLKQSMHCNHVLQHHYPERLGLAICYHAPMLFSLTWKATQPFIDPVTKQKIVFVDKGAKEAQEMNSRFHMEKMEQCLGGGHKGTAYSMEEYEKVGRQYDAEVQAELDAMEAGMKAALAKVADPAIESGMASLTVDAH